MNWQPPSFPPHRHRTTQQQQVGQLIIAGALVIFLPQLPLGNYLLYPFTILTTWFHEMGHGLAALALGWEFERLVLLADGSGYAESYSPADPGALAAAFVSLGGPLGPSVIGAALIAATRRHEWWRPALYALATIILLSTLIWVRSMVGFVVLPLIAAALVAIALRARGGLVRFAVQFLGVLGALSMLRDWHYLFSYSGMIGGRPRRSYYFLGCQGERVLYLDPHEVQPALRADAPQLPSCHFAQPPRTMPMREIDPSLALGFLCPTPAAFDDLCARCADAFAGSLPAFSIATAPPDFSRLSGGEEEGEGGDDDDGVVL